MSREWTEALTTLHATEDGTALEGIIVPYGVATADERRHVFAPGAFAKSVAYWMDRKDGARLAFRRAHNERPIGTVTTLDDRTEGVYARVDFLTGSPDAESYSREVAAGLNGVSVEAGNFGGATRMKDGTVVYRSATLHAVAGSVTPAFDGARVSLHDLEEPMDDDKDKTPETPAPAPESAKPVETFDRVALEGLVRTAFADSGIRQTRPDFIYGPGREYGMLSDGWAAAHGDRDATERQDRHFALLTDLSTETYAGDVVVSEIPGAYPNEYLPGLFTPRILKGRPMGSFFNRIATSDALPKVYPKAGTATTVAVQGAELTNPAASDFTTTAITVTPALYGAETVVSRQVLDGSNPGAEGMILSDMLEAYAQASETVIKTAVEAGASASGTAITAATPFAGLVGNIVAYSVARFRAAEGVFIPSALWAVAAKQGDTGSLRPLLSPIGPQNAVGALTGGTLGAVILEADVFHSYASTTNVVVTAVRDDYVIFESSIARFSYDAVTGPAGVRIGLWAYLGVGARKGGLSVTAA